MQPGLVWETLKEHLNGVLDTPKKSLHDSPAWRSPAENKSVLRIANASKDIACRRCKPRVSDNLVSLHGTSCKYVFGT